MFIYFFNPYHQIDKLKNCFRLMFGINYQLEGYLQDKCSVIWNDAF